LRAPKASTCASATSKSSTSKSRCSCCGRSALGHSGGWWFGASWKASVKDKLETLDDVYRFAVEQLAISRGHFLELVVVVILLFELALFFLGIMT
jgi:hypothetical protein